MATRVVKIQAQSIGADSGPFTISDDVLGVLDSNVPRTSILGGYNVNSDTTATQITIASSGPCPDSVTIPIDFVVCPTGPTPTIEWYQLQKCTDLTYTTSTYYNINSYEVNDRVTDGNGVVYIVTAVYSSDPGGAQIAISSTGLVGCPPTPPPPDPTGPPPPTYYYYSGLLCGGGIMEYFRSTDPALQDHAGVVKAWCAICGGGSEQCFDNISPSLVVNTNDVIAVFGDCVNCAADTVSVTGVYGSMEPCIGGTIDDYMGVSVSLGGPVTVDTTFDIVVNYISPGNTCSNTNYTQYFVLTVPAGANYASINACSNGAYIPGGAAICSTCIANCDNPNVDLTGFAC